MGDGSGASFGTVYTMPSWYDGPREGVADYQGRPHLFVSEWSDVAGLGSDSFQLMPIDPETFDLALEDWAIWLRWSAAFHRGETTRETHPALPEDRDRHIDPSRASRASGEFQYGLEPGPIVFDRRPWTVRWTRIN